MARAYVIRFLDAEFHISGNKTEIARLFLIFSRNTIDAMKYRGHLDDHFWDSEESDALATIANLARDFAYRVDPDYCHGLFDTD